MRKIYYPVEEYPFAEIVKDIIGGFKLEELHFVRSYDKFKRKNDQSTIFHKRFYKKYEQMEDMFVKFVEEKIQPMHGEPIIYQKIPTFRVHMPNNIAVGEWHKDREYRNAEWAGKVKEVNYFIPLTSAHGTNTVWAESKEGWGDFLPMEAEYGEMIEWDASNLTHGNKENTTGQTRVSFDFRIIPESRYIDSDHLTINTKIPFSLGGYYQKSKMVYNTMS